MFEQVLIEEVRRFWSTCLGVTAQAALVASLILAPMLWPEALPKLQALLTLLMPPVPLPPPLKAAPAPQRAPAVPRRSIMNLDSTINVPRSIPLKIAMLDEAPPAPGGPGVPGGLSNLLATTFLAPPRPVEKAAPAPEPARLRIGGVVLEGKLTSRVEPQYPPLARQMRVQGAVELLAIVGTDGRIRELSLLSGSPLLAPAAMEAVRRWVYRPTFLNDSPVEIMAPITVNFKLN